MTATERAQVLVTARLLEAAARVDMLSSGVILIAIAAMLFAMPEAIVGIIAIGLGVAVKFYGVRIAFDARLFADIAAEHLSADDLDAAFPSKAGRIWSERCAGAKGLVVVQGMLFAVQCAASVAMGLL